MAVKHYVDEIPPSTGRAYQIKTEGSSSQIIDITKYQQVGTGFGASDVNSACVLECNYSKSGTVHKLTTENTASENIKFFATADYNRGDTFTFNGTAVTAQTTDGQALGTHFFKANTIVNCSKRGDVLYFEGAFNESLLAHEIAIKLLLTHAKQQEWNQDDIRAAVSSETGTVTLTNNSRYPFNNSQKTVALKTARPNAQYVVVPQVISTNGNVGEIEVSDILENGFKLAFTGSASSVTVNYKIIGGYTV